MVTRKTTKRKRRPLAEPTKATASPVVVIKPDPAVWSKALDLASGEVKRLAVQPDGSVIVHNNPVQSN